MNQAGQACGTRAKFMFAEGTAAYMSILRAPYVDYLVVVVDIFVRKSVYLYGNVGGCGSQLTYPEYTYPIDHNSKYCMYIQNVGCSHSTPDNGVTTGYYRSRLLRTKILQRHLCKQRMPLT